MDDDNGRSGSESQQVAVGAGMPGWRPEQIPELYRELRRTARALRRRHPSDTLNTTAVVHEAWLRYLGDHPAWRDRQHFFASAAVVMRRVLVDYARYRTARKRSAESDAVPLFELEHGDQASALELLALDQALERLETADPRSARLVELRTFGGLTFQEAAAALGVTARTAERDWVRARAFLKLHLGP